MVEGLALTILASGFLILSKHPYHSFRLYRYSGEFLHVCLLRAGLYALLLVTLLHLLIDRWFSSYQALSMKLHWIWMPPLRAEELGPLWFPGGPLCVAAAWFWSWLSHFVFVNVDNAWVKQQGDSVLSLALMYELFNEGSMDRLFLYSIVEKAPVLLSLVSGKFYIGILCRLGEPNEKDAPNQEFSLLPIIAGYQNERGEKISTYILEQANQLDRFTTELVVLPRHVIVSAEQLVAVV